MSVFWFIVAIIVIGYIATMFRALWLEDGQPIPQLRVPFLHLIDEPEEAAVVFIILGIVIAIAGYAFLYGLGTLRDVVGDFYANIAMEFVSVAITVLIIERLYERRSNLTAEKEEKERLILQMGSPNNGFAIEATRQLKKRGWLIDGSLVGADLEKAKLLSVELDGADLREANMSHASLLKAHLKGANLSYSNLTKACIRLADLKGANLSNAYLYHADAVDVNFHKANGMCQ